MARGFYNAPIAKILVMSGIVLTGLSAIPSIRPFIFIDDQSSITKEYNIWRLFTSLMPAEYLAEGIVQWILLYILRNFEREMGSSKFAAFILLATLFGMLTRGILAAIIPVSLMVGEASGPYHLIFGLLPLYYKYVPVVKHDLFTLCGIHCSEKTMTYVLAVLLMFCRGWASFFPSVSSLLLGILYQIDALRLNRLAFPKVVRKFFSTYILPLIQSSPTPQVRPTAVFAGQRRTNQVRQRVNARPADVETEGLLGPPPSEESIQRLLALGFPRERVVNALRQAFGNEERAADILLE